MKMCANIPCITKLNKIIYQEIFKRKYFTKDKIKQNLLPFKNVFRIHISNDSLATVRIYATKEKGLSNTSVFISIRAALSLLPSS